MNEDKADLSTVIDPKVPLARQTDKLLKVMNKQEAKKTEEAPEATKEAPKEVDAKDDIEEQEPQSYFQDREEEAPEATQLPAKTWQEHVQNGVRPITVQGMVGEEPISVSAYSYDDLPKGFKFSDDVEAGKASTAFNKIYAIAEKLQQEFIQAEKDIKNQADYAKYQDKVAREVDKDRQWLQSNGILPKFKYEWDDPKFNSDPAVKEANDIFNLYKKAEKENNEYFARTGVSHVISYKDAAYQYYHDKMKAEKSDPKGKTRDDPAKNERDKVARKISAPAGGDGGTVKPRAFAGMSFKDVNRLAKAGKI